tara:strand:+ start:208 stop:621 length:414 start_codon:yes stop_codon:yes gene_type:complete
MSFKYHLDKITSAANYLDKNIQTSIVCFDGPMGAGKTTLISALCNKWDVKDQVSSPTFSIINHYESEIKGPLYHFDFYRLNRLEEALDIGIEEYLESGNICLIEWGDRIKSLLPENIIIIDIALEKNNFRNLKITHK